MKTAVTILLGLAGFLAVLPAFYLLSLAVAASALRPRRMPRANPSCLAVLVPAHNEAELIGRCVRSLLGQTYPRLSYRVIVIADNCSDQTAEESRAAGAEVMVRDEPAARGKGQALRWAMDKILARPTPPDALVVVDADSVAHPDLLWELEVERAAGAEVVQADYMVTEEDRSPQSQLVGLAFLLFHRVRLGGRKALGLPANLAGNGMLFNRGVLERQPWSAFTGAEDLEYSIHLRMAGVRPVFAPVFGLAVAVALTATGLAAIAAVFTWVVALVAVVGFVTAGLRAAGAPASTYLTLLRLAPAYLLRKVSIYVKILRGEGLTSWVRTPRPGENSADRVWLAGVPIDPVAMPAAVARILGGVGGGNLMQICTVNLDFLVRAQTNADIARILAHAELNVADGAPVVWLSRLTGGQLPGRIAGADLVPQVIAGAAEHGASVFLLGGQDGVAHRARNTLLARHPTLRIAGVHEPPLMKLDAMDDDSIVGLVNASKADILIVALGHPKQELWIDRHRDQLRVSVAIGAGCCLDLIAGQVRRAPGWMQAVGLEWLFRLLQEPRRLARRYATDAAWLAWIVPGLISHRLIGSRS